MISGEEVAVTVILTILAAYFWFKSVMTIRKKLIEAKAVSPESAAKLEEAGIPWWCMLHLELVAEKTKDERYYLPSERKRLTTTVILITLTITVVIVGVILNINPFLLITLLVVAMIVGKVASKNVQKANI